MRKTILAYILNCIEEIEDDKELGAEIRSLHEVIFQEIEKKSDDLLNVLFLYIMIFPTEEQLGLEVRALYNEINYFFNEYTTGIRTNSH
jgi:hypothetical protein